MKKSKRMLLELTNLPVVRKKLIPEGESVKFNDLEPGNIIQLPKFKNKKFIITGVSQLGQYIHFVELRTLEMAKKDELEGAKIATLPTGPWKSIEA